MADVGGFFKRMGSAISDAADKTAKTAGDLAEKGKYKVEISKYESEIKTIKANLGKDIIDGKLAGKGDAEVLEMVQEAFTKVESLNTEIARVQTQISEVGVEKVEDLPLDEVDAAIPAEAVQTEAVEAEAIPSEGIQAQVVESEVELPELDKVDTCGCGIEKDSCVCHPPKDIEILGDNPVKESSDSGIVDL